MTQEKIQFMSHIWQFHLADAWDKDALREEIIYEIKSCKYIRIFLEVLCSSNEPHTCDDGVDVLKQIDSELLEIYLRYTTEDVGCYNDPLYILIRAAGKHKQSHVFKKEILDRMYSSYDTVREAVVEALYDMGDFENLKQISQKDRKRWIRELAKELLLEGDE